MSSDEILVNQLKRANFKDASNFNNCANVTSQQLISAAVFIFDQIPTTKGKLGEQPKSKALQFNFANKLVELMQSLNYIGDLTYDTFLMPKEDKTRSIVSFLLSKIPAQQAQAPAAQTSTGYSPLFSAAQNAFEEAKKKKPEAREPLAQPFPLINASISEQTKKAISATQNQPKIPFFAIPILNNGYSISHQCGPNSFASLLAANDRETDLDELTATKKKADINQIKKITKRAFVVQPVTIDFSYQTIQSKAPPKATIKSNLENVARFEFTKNDESILNAVAVQSKTVKTSLSDSKLSKLASISKAVEESALVPNPEETSETPEEKAEREAQKEAERQAEEQKQREEEERRQKEEEERAKDPPLTNEQIETLKAELKSEKQEAIGTLQTLESKFNEVEQAIDEEQDEFESLQTELNDLVKENEKLEIELEKVKKVAQVSQADASQIRKLQKDLVGHVSNLLEIANEYEPKRLQLIEEYRTLSASIKRRDQDKQLMMNKITKLRKSIQDDQQHLQETQEQITHMEEVNGNAPSDQHHRHHYVEMILDHIKKLQQQEEEVEKVRTEIRSQNQRMNQTIETVKRTWQLLEGTIYSKAKEKNQDWMKKTYKMAVELLTLYESISEEVENSGKCSAQTMELDQKIERLENQIDNDALERVQNDLKTLREEIDQIRASMPQEEEEVGQQAEQEEADDLDE